LRFETKHFKIMLNLNFDPFPTLHTQRLVLRKMEMSDDQDIFFLRSDKKVNEFIDMNLTRTIDDARTHINKIDNIIAKGEGIYWVISLPERKNLIGTICIWNISTENEKAETGYVLHPDFVGQGYMHEALEAVVKIGFEYIGLKTIEAFTRADNERSTRLLASLNFARDFEEEKRFVEDGIIIPEAIFSLRVG